MPPNMLSVSFLVVFCIVRLPGGSLHFAAIVSRSGITFQEAVCPVFGNSASVKAFLVDTREFATQSVRFLIFEYQNLIRSGPCSFILPSSDRLIELIPRCHVSVVTTSSGM